MVENSTTNDIFIFVLFISIISLVSLVVSFIWISIFKRPEKESEINKAEEEHSDF